MKKIRLRYKIIFIIVFLALLIFDIVSLVNYFDAKTYYRNNLIAIDHSSKAIDAIESIRDKNWLLSPDEPNCWLELNPDKNPGCAERITIGEHYILKETDNGWRLVNVPGELNLENGPDYDYRLEVGCNETIFYRDIYILKVEDSDHDSIENHVIFEVVVEWTEGRKVQSLERSFGLFNYIQ